MVGNSRFDNAIKQTGQPNNAENLATVSASAVQPLQKFHILLVHLFLQSSNNSNVTEIGEFCCLSMLGN